MFKWLSGLKRQAPDRPLAPEQEIFAVGDIHGRLDLLQALMEKIHEATTTKQPEIIFLGDYVDRGPQSRQVVEFLLSSNVRPFFRPVFLKGNHEATLLEFLEDHRVGPQWVQYGGGETLMSYDVKPPEFKSDDEAWEQASIALRRQLPGSHLKFYKNLELTAERGCYLFVHAGVDPGKAITAQSESDLLWVREAFLDDTRLLERIIVHGHTPAPEPYRDERRIGLDLGGYQTGRLAAARLQGGDISFIMN